MPPKGVERYVAERNEVHSEHQVQLDAKDTSSATGTPDELVNMGISVWAFVKKRLPAGADDATKADVLASAQKEFKDFSTTFPLVVRMAVDASEFSSKALRLTVAKYATLVRSGRLTEEAFLDVQAFYVQRLARVLHPSKDARKWARYDAAVVDSLKRDAAKLKQIQQEISDEIKKADAAEKKALIESLRDDMHALRRQAAAAPAAAPATAPAAAIAAPASAPTSATA